MKTCLLLTIFLSIGCVEHIASQDTYRWTTNEIVVQIDPTMEEIAGDETYVMIEESIMYWIDDTNIDVDFVYAQCDYTVSCVKMMDYNPELVGHDEITKRSGSVSRVIITISRDLNWSLGDGIGYDFERTIAHEWGHTMGYGHTDNPSDVMYEFIPFEQ